MKLKMTKKKLLAAIVSTALLCGVGVGGTVAWLHDSAQVTNKFDLASTGGSIDEDFDNYKKEDVKVANTGEVDAYVRVALSISFENTDGTIANVTPVADENYTVVWGDTDNWKQGSDGFWYYLSPLPAKEGDQVSSTENLIDSISPKGEAADDLKFRVDVSAQLIQAEPEDAVIEAWDVAVDQNGNLVVN
ncbi:MAG TPA: hypothetical protein IAB55_10675 [Candidatus Merdivicinus faecavium]|nr:hypothetical protein [Candidatus Merdivicinus faecavium]